MPQETMESWDGFLGSNFLNPEQVNDENHEFVCRGTEFDEENKRPMLILDSGEIKAIKWSLNITNSNFINNAGIKSPKECIGKKITFKKVMAFSPKAKTEVESLRIKSIE